MKNAAMIVILSLLLHSFIAFFIANQRRALISSENSMSEYTIYIKADQLELKFYMDEKEH